MSARVRIAHDTQQGPGKLNEMLNMRLTKAEGTRRLSVSGRQAGDILEGFGVWREKSWVNFGNGLALWREQRTSWLGGFWAINAFIQDELSTLLPSTLGCACSLQEEIMSLFQERNWKLDPGVRAMEQPGSVRDRKAKICEWKKPGLPPASPCFTSYTWPDFNGHSQRLDRATVIPRKTFLWGTPITKVLSWEKLIYLISFFI